MYRERISETKRKSKWKKLCRPVSYTLAGKHVYEILECAVCHAQKINTSFCLVINNQPSPDSGDFVARKFQCKVTRPFFFPSEYKLKKRSGLATRDYTESWADFGDTLLSLVDRAFLDLPDNAREALALERFLSQLIPLQISFSVRQRKTKCVREAVCATLEAESHLIAHHSNNHQKQHNELLREDQPPATIATDTHLQQLERMAETLKDIQLKIINCETIPSAIRESQPKLKPHHTIVCQKCQQMGHYARGCASNRQKR